MRKYVTNVLTCLATCASGDYLFAGGCYTGWTACPVGFYASGSNPIACLVCTASNGTNCFKCTSGKILGSQCLTAVSGSEYVSATDTNSNQYWKGTCMNGYYLSNTSCLVCNTSGTANCLTCETTDTNCLTCTTGYAWENGKCVTNTCVTGVGYYAPAASS